MSTFLAIATLLLIACIVILVTVIFKMAHSISKDLSSFVAVVKTATIEQSALLAKCEGLKAEERTAPYRQNRD
jgi:Na+-transporting NADH:ubiquinone oxidoreductase subunit NqrD